MNTPSVPKKIGVGMNVSCLMLLSAVTLLPAQMPRPIVLGAPARNAAAVPADASVTADFSTPKPSEQTMHLVVGHSIFVNTKHRLSRVYVTNPAVLDSYTVSPNQIVVTAKGAGVSTLIIWDESGDSQVYMVSADINVDELQSALNSALPNGTVKVSGVEGRITLSGTVGSQAMSEAAAKIAGMYGKEVSNSLLVNSSKIRQVRLKVRFVEIERSKLSQFGFSFFSLAGSTFVSGSTLQFPNTLTTGNATGTSFPVGGVSVAYSNPLNFMVYSAKYNVGAALQDLESKNVLQILAEPTMTAMSGQKANFLAGGEFPFPVVQGASQGFTSVSVQFRPFGVKLDFTPLVNADNTIDLSISPEVSALDYTNAVTISGYTIPAISTRRATTEVVLRSGQSFVLTGLLDKRTTDSYSRTPGFAAVPFIGALFRSKNFNHSQSELVVIVTPEIIDPLSTDDVITEPKAVVPVLDVNQFDQSVRQKSIKNVEKK